MLSVPTTRKKELIQKLWKDDEANLLNLPEYPFPVFRYASLTVSKNGFATIETNKYGLSPALSGETVQAKIFFDHVEFFHDHRSVGSYPRSYKKGDEVYDWTQYVSVLCKKPGATLHTRFFRQMPQQWQSLLEQASGKERKTPCSCSVRLYLTAMSPSAMMLWSSPVKTAARMWTASGSATT